MLSNQIAKLGPPGGRKACQRDDYNQTSHAHYLPSPPKLKGRLAVSHVCKIERVFVGSEREQAIEKQGSLSLLRLPYGPTALAGRNRGVSRSPDRLSRYRL